MLLDDIKGNRIRRCIRCGRVITENTDSGWQEFLPDGRTTQPLCVMCDSIPQSVYQKAGDKQLPRLP